MKKTDIVYFYSNSIKGFDLNKVTSSSEKYVLSLAVSLSQYVKVIILTNKLKFNDRKEKFNIELIGLSDSKKSEKKCLKEILKADKQMHPVIFWGYKLSTVLLMLKVKKYNKRIFSFVFDSHKPALKHYRPMWKNKIIDFCFCMGRYFGRFLDCFIFFQDNAIKRFNVEHKPVLVTKPGVFPFNKKLNNNSNKFNITFCGSFTELNGIDIILSVAEKMCNCGLEFNFVGDGPLLPLISRSAKINSHIKLFDRTTADKIEDIYTNTNILLNIRRLDDEAMDFAFPSKTFECASTSIPMVTTKVMNDFVFLENAAILDDVNEICLEKIIGDIVSHYDVFCQKARILKNYIDKKYSFDNCALTLCEFINYNL